MSELAPGTIVSVYAIFASEEEALSIGRKMIEERHAACVNILGRCLSVFRWQGKIEQTEEVAAIFKTSSGQASQLIEAIARLHSYEVPAAVVWPIADAPEAYRSWVIANSER